MWNFLEKEKLKDSLKKTAPCSGGQLAFPLHAKEESERAPLKSFVPVLDTVGRRHEQVASNLGEELMDMSMFFCICVYKRTWTYLLKTNILCRSVKCMIFQKAHDSQQNLYARPANGRGLWLNWKLSARRPDEVAK